MKKIILLLFGFTFNIYFTQSFTTIHPFFDDLKTIFDKKNDSVKKDSVDETQAYLEDVTRSFTSKSSNAITLSSFPKLSPNFILGSDATGWSYLNTSTQISVDKNQNTALIEVDGTAQIDNLTKESSFQFAIGIFIDDELKLVKIFYVNASEMKCSFKKFNIAGVFENLPVGSHVVKVYAYNLPKLSSNYSNITYGGAASNSCNNLNEEMARIFLTAQVAE